ncbi:hypothetical protein ONS96_000948 [Cadophora gregata f. sp. sojae]|nr:hypothetical protein ONS96_000948 [Cadophora gregata f. sp. sojae]
MQRAEERADEDHEDFVGQRPFYLPYGYVYKRDPVPRPERGSYDCIRHQSYRDTFALAGATAEQLEEFFDEFYIEEKQPDEEFQEQDSAPPIQPPQGSRSSH